MNSIIKNLSFLFIVSPGCFIGSKYYHELENITVKDAMEALKNKYSYSLYLKLEMLM